MPELVIGEERFEGLPQLSPWRLMKLAKSQQGSEMEQLAGLYDFIVGTVVVEERPRLTAWLDDHDVSMDELNSAVGTLMRSYTARPTERPSHSPSGATSTGPRSRVVSLSRGTAREAETSSTDGAPAVS